MLAYLSTGNLPWQRFATKAKHHGKIKMIPQLKEMFSLHESYGKYPLEIIKFIKYARYLGFEECPDYEGWRNKFKKYYPDTNEKFIYDWEASLKKLRHSSSVPNSIAKHALKDFKKEYNNYSRKRSLNIRLYGINKNYNTIARAQDSFHSGIQCKEDAPLDCSKNEEYDNNNLDEEIPDEIEIPIAIKTNICIRANPKRPISENKMRKSEVATSEGINISTEDRKVNIT